MSGCFAEFKIDANALIIFRFLLKLNHDFFYLDWKPDERLHDRKGGTTGKTNELAGEP